MNGYKRVGVLIFSTFGLLWMFVNVELPERLWEPLLLLVMLFIVSASPIKTDKITFSLLFPVLFPAIILMPPPIAGLIGAIGSIQRIQLSYSLTSFMANRVMVGIPAYVSSYFFHNLFFTEDIFSAKGIFILIITAVVYALLNSIMALVLSVVIQGKLEPQIIMAVIGNLLNYGVSIFLGIITIFVYMSSIPFFIISLLIFCLNKDFFRAAIINKQLYYEVISAMVKVIENADAYTRGHSERVATYVRALGQELGLNRMQLEGLHLTALLHDLGKQSISGDVLRKPGKLSSSEFDLIKTHPAAGVKILEGISLFRPQNLYAIEQHHERWDGKGYPKGLKGDEISLWARIIAVADAFDAMTTKRSYRAELSLEEAFEELRRNAGAQFDPKMVEPFIKACLKLSLGKQEQGEATEKAAGGIGEEAAEEAIKEAVKEAAAASDM